MLSKQEVQPNDQAHGLGTKKQKRRKIQMVFRRFWVKEPCHSETKKAIYCSIVARVIYRTDQWLEQTHVYTMTIKIHPSL